MGVCTRCGKESGKHKYCEDCISDRSNACSVIRQNSNKLAKLFGTKRYTPEGFEKFGKYIRNIQKQITILVEFLEKDNERRFKSLK